MQRAETIELTEESEGFELQITTFGGVTFTVNVHGVLDQILAVGETIDAYYREGRALAEQHELELQHRAAQDETLHGLGDFDAGGEA